MNSLSYRPFASHSVVSRKMVRRFLAIVVAGASLAFLPACGTEMLTYSNDAKKDGIHKFNDGDFASAAGSFRNAIRQNPADPESEYWLGRSYENSQSYHEAINAYETCLRLMPAPSSTNYMPQMADDTFDRLAHIVAKVDASNTETNVLTARANEESSPAIHQLLGRIARYRGDADTALLEYRAAIQLDTQNFAVKKEMGIYLVQLGQNSEAANTLRDAYRLNSDDKDVQMALRNIGMEPGPGLLPQDQTDMPTNASLRSQPAKLGKITY